MESIRHKLGLPLNLYIRYRVKVLIRIDPVSWWEIHNTLSSRICSEIENNICNMTQFGVTFPHIY